MPLVPPVIRTALSVMSIEITMLRWFALRHLVEPAADVEDFSIDEPGLGGGQEGDEPGDIAGFACASHGAELKPSLFQLRIHGIFRHAGFDVTGRDNVRGDSLWAVFLRNALDHGNQAGLAGGIRHLAARAMGG